MRSALRDAGACEHAGLAYTLACPPGAVRPQNADEREQRERWLDAVVKLAPPEDYRHAYEAWCTGLVARAVAPAGARRVCLARGTLRTPLLVGHGNAAPSEVGLTLHHTWGVPLIPGSALKGLVAHYAAATYGPEKTDRAPDDARHAEPDRARFQAPRRRDDGRVQFAPGDAYRRLFGAPEVEEAAQPRDLGSAGCVVFHDALLASETSSGAFLVHDVLTPHHKRYYESDTPDWPNEYENPEPVPFVSVRPGLVFLFAVAGPPEWAELALWLLREALADWGVGGKTARGYGRFAFEPGKDAQWLAGERRARENRQLPSRTPFERWRILVERATPQELLRWAQEVFRDRKKHSLDLEPLLAGQALDADVEDEALRQALLAAGHVENWRTGRDVESSGRSAEKLRALADAVDPPPPPPPEAEWHQRLRGLDAKDFDALKRLAGAARADPGAWPSEALEALLKRLRSSLGKNPKPAKRAFVDDFERHVRERRRGGGGDTR